ncbi:MAG TPA: imidazole glycerol phosphate synthase subunit HisH [Rhodopirellula baltica]|uniref:Imidazole glycerol phosphate synthase subunit HisH n=3 Tax=Rhodopirellula TaxID=265488 RepID=HIS5_RHOBA|nr:imidazole glycerol phosphate synthase subunit HisH [Rhodopirellula baltica]Q7ULP3.1 RecName: Full=Imidazole glycerol phosphate synthase subunit HisH; AltName: Full=IGP synthase glutaminase subunit; AltName: Full=IGP synthase subunit HisH; AltName: Full=ImGP synthase subunit HisH; Short=IGPS subunit HisH [Rhodopirellula baltica SH 1]EKK00310.1 imidazole glycerol phosphate synthase, glutamine amidotransferase subunit [Rhodopirellula baltica SH28]CAD76226.1 amidotransferase hisH [Rhodopirellula 
MITIVDYQMGNLRSVQKAVERSGVEAEITSDASQIAAAERLILPGVGAFGDAIGEIRRRDLEKPIKDFIASGKPFLGICLGLQMLFEQGFEGGTHEGLGVLGGDVVAFELPAEFKVPHMGWNAVDVKDAGADLGIQSGTHFYFVHSYFVRPADPSVVALTCDYGGEFCAAVRRGNLMATQFHPEKSQGDGLRLMQRFATAPVEVA